MELIELDLNCVRCGEIQTITVTKEQLEELNEPNRRKIQDILPNHSASDREMFITGICNKCWDKMFK